MTECGPPPKEVQDFLFKQASVGQICDEFTTVPINSSLIASDGKRGILYIGHGNKLLVVKPANDSNPEWKLDIDLPGTISRVGLSCDNSLLAVTFNSPSVFIYDAASIHKHKLDLLHEIRLSTSGGDILVKDLKWNPAIPEMLCSITSDHTIGCYQVGKEKKAGIQIQGMERLQGLDALCISWSPKGKQLVVGCKGGDIVQLKPELKVARHLPAPNPNEGMIVSILWISNYQFCACYFHPTDQRVSLMIVDAPKGATVAKFTNYEDVTFGTGSMDGLCYYFEHIPEWGVIVIASTHSSEVSVLGTLDNGATWHQWQLMDDSTAQLPLNRKKKTENYPVGMAIDKSPTDKLPWGSDSFLPNPVPILRILVTSGQLCCYHMVNLKSNAPSICSAPTEVVSAPVAPRTSILPSEISFNMHAGVTSTPRSKQINSEIIPDNPKASMNMFSTSTASSFSFLGPASKGPDGAAATAIQNNTPFSATQETKPGIFKQGDAKSGFFQQQNKQSTVNTRPHAQLIPTTTIHPQNVQTEVQNTPPSFNLKVGPKSVSTQQIQLDNQRQQLAGKIHKEQTDSKSSIKDQTIYDESQCLRLYYEEQVRFEKELKARLDLPNCNLGTEEEREYLIKSSNEIDDFLRELRDTTSSLESDIAYLKALLLQSFAWIEESKSRSSAHSLGLSGRAYKENSKLAELQRLYTYTQNQLIQATKALDSEWSEYQNREEQRMKIPSTEVIYQSLFRYNQIIQTEKRNLEELNKKWKSLLRGGIKKSLGLTNGHIAALDKSLSSMSISHQPVTASEGAIELRCKLIAKNTKHFSKEKQMKLKDLLSESAPKVIRAARPTAIQDRLEATLSSLASAKATDNNNITKVEKDIQHKPSGVAAKTSTTLSSLENLVSGFKKSEDTPSSALDSASKISQQTTVPQLKSIKETVKNPSPQNKSITEQNNLQKIPETPKSTIEASDKPFTITTSFTKLKDSSTTSPPSISTMPKSTFSFSSTSGTVPPNFTVPKLDSTAFKFSTTNTLPTNTLDLSNMGLTGKTNLPVPTTMTFSKTPASSTAATSMFGGLTVQPISNVTTVLEKTSVMTGPTFTNAAPKLPASTTTQATSSIFGTSSLFGSLSSVITTGSSTFNFSAPTTTISTTSVNLPSFGTITSSIPSSLPSFSSLSLTSSTLNFGTPSSNALSASNTFGKSPQTIETSSSANNTLFGNSSASNSSTTASPIPTSSAIMTSIPSGLTISVIPSTTKSKATESSTTTITTTVGTPSNITASNPNPISIHGGQTTITAVSSNTFASKPEATTTATNATSPALKVSIFGGGTTASATNSTIFGGAAQTFGLTATSQSNNVFGTSNSLSSSAAPFTPNNTATTTAASFNKSPSNTPTTSIFGGANNTNAGTTSSIFGNSAVAATTATTTTTTTTSSSVFGNTVFSSTPSSSGTAPTFGTTPFASTTAVATSSSPSIFGGSSLSKNSTFGSSTVFGSSATFGAANTGAPAFGSSGPSTTSTPVFGTATTSTTTTTPFGGSSVFGGASSATPLSSSVFGGASTAPASGSIFGGASTTPTNGPIFGGAAANNQNVFGAANTGSVFSSSATLGSGTIAFGGGASQSPMGSPFGQASTFGSKPVFGTTTPAFGGSPGFGSPPAFGSVPSTGFGSPPTIGSASPIGAGTSPNKVFGSPTFETLGAQSGGLSFGSLAQKSPEQHKPAQSFQGSSSFSSWR